MGVSYRKLFVMMEEKGIKKIDLRSKYGLNPKTVDSLTKDKGVTVETIMSLCAVFDCQPGDIMEYVPDEPETDKGQGGILHSGDDIANGKFV